MLFLSISFYSSKFADIDPAFTIKGVLCKFSGSEIEQCPFFSVDPAFIHETASCFVPIFDSDGSPALLLLLTSTEKSFKFDDADVRFLQKVGGIVYGSLLKQRVVDAGECLLQNFFQDRSY